MNTTDLAVFTEAYTEALFFTDSGSDNEVDSDAELSEELRLDIEADCRSFWRRFGCFVTTDVCKGAFADPIAQAGHDFHFTRNGHGVGFWEEEWPKPYRDMLDAAAKAYGELSLYQGDDSLAYAS